MKLLGYPSNEGGVCYGITYMGLQAIIAQDLETFDARIDMINAIDEYFEKYSNKKKEIQNSKDSLYKTLNIILNYLQNEKITIQNKQIFNEIPAFFEGIELYFHPDLYPDLFEENKPKIQHQSELVMPLTSSKALEKEEIKGIEQAPYVFSGVYTKEELKDYFKSLQEVIKKTNFTEPIALVLESSDHAISVGYDSKAEKWFLIDPNILPTKYNLDNNEIAQKVLAAFTTNNTTTFATKMYAASLHQEKLKKVNEAWQKHETWQTLHKISSEKIKRVDSHGAGWLYVAAKMGLLEEVTNLLKETDIDPNLSRTMTGISPLFIAAFLGHLEVVKSLLAHPDIKLDMLTKKGNSCVDIARSNNQHDVVIVLERAIRIRQLLNTEKNTNSPRYQALQLYYQKCLAANNEDAEQIEKNFRIIEACHNIQINYKSEDNEQIQKALNLINECVTTAYQEYTKGTNLNEIIENLQDTISNIAKYIKYVNDHHEKNIFKQASQYFFKTTPTESRLYTMIQKIPFPKEIELQDIKNLKF
jgi:hypothetical protein